MRELFFRAGFSNDETKSLVTHLYKSGSLSPDFINGLINHIEGKEPERDKLTQAQKIILEGAATKSKTAGVFDPDKFFEAFALLPKEYLLAIIQAGHQRYFQDEVVVGLQQPTKYSEANKDSILALAEQMAMTHEQRVNPTDGVREKVDIGVAIGATSTMIQSYLENQKRIFDNRSNPGAPYKLYILLGDRKLGNTASDNPQELTASFVYADTNSDGIKRDYLSYLSEKYSVDRTALTENHAMRDRFEKVYGKTVEQAQAQAESLLKPITAKNAELFFNEVASDLRTAAIASQTATAQEPKTLVLTTVQPFNRTYQTIMHAALETNGIDNGFVVKSDGGKGTTQPQTIMREFAKIINAQYLLIARKSGIENPVSPEVLSGAEIKKLEVEIATEKVKTPGGMFAG